MNNAIICGACHATGTGAELIEAESRRSACGRACDRADDPGGQNRGTHRQLAALQDRPYEWEVSATKRSSAEGVGLRQERPFPFPALLQRPAARSATKMRATGLSYEAVSCPTLVQEKPH
jgi:hypothetical protein